MSYISTESMLEQASKGGFAVGAFNCENLEMAMAIIAAGEELGAPVILQTTPSTLKYASPAVFAAMVRTIAERSSSAVALHLDHGSSFELCREAIEAGYTSVMIDGSKESLEDNIALTKRVVELASPHGIPVEAELGTVGGKEDSTVSNGTVYTDPDDALRFVRETGCSSLAIGIGTAHGIYHGTPVLDVERITAIKNKLEANGCAVPLVLHGASGLSDDAVRECVARGIAKVNFATELRQAYTVGVKKLFAADPDAFDPKKYGKSAMAEVKATVISKIKVL